MKSLIRAQIIDLMAVSSAAGKISGLIRIWQEAWQVIMEVLMQCQQTLVMLII